MAAPQWVDVSELSFEVLLLLEDPHLHWFPRDWPGDELGVALRHNRSVWDSFRVRLRGEGAWLDELVARAPQVDPEGLRRCEVAVMRAVCDWIVYVHRPEAYDAQPFLRWDDAELLTLVDPRDKVVVDVGSGTGRLLEPLIAEVASAFAVEPIRHLRSYLKRKFAEHAHKLNVLDGFITDLPLPASSCDIVLAGHVVGDDPERELSELERVARPGGRVVLCPGNNDVDDGVHEVIASRGYEWSVFEEPGDGLKRKYWKPT